MPTPAPRCWFVAACLALVGALASAPLASARAADSPVRGVRIRLQTDGAPRDQRLRVTASGRGISTDRDPRRASSWVQVQADGAGGGSTGHIELDPDRWKIWKNEKGDRGYQYRDPKGSRGGIEKIVLRHGKLIVRAGGRGWSLAPQAAVDSVSVHFGVGAESVCATFGGDVQRNRAGDFKAKDAAKPEACPEIDVCEGQAFESTFAALQDRILEDYGCTNGLCHGAEPGWGGLNLLPEVAYAELVGPSADGSAYRRVEAGEPDASALYLKLLKAVDPDASDIPGLGMPSGGALSEDHLEAVRLWIEADAPESGSVSAADELLGACTPPGDAQRTGLRRLTRLEYGYALQDLLGIDQDTARDLGASLPAETDSGGFDTVAEKQGLSPLHIRSYLDAADRALDAAVKTGPRPETRTRVIEYARSTYLPLVENGAAIGLGIVLMLDDAAVQFIHTACTYSFHAWLEGYQVTQPGRYRVSLEAYPYQPHSLVTMTLFRATLQTPGLVSLDELIGAWDLVDPEPRRVELETVLQPGDVLAPCVDELNSLPGDGIFRYFQPGRFVKDGYTGEGVAFKTLTIEGPLAETWPPQSTRDLLVGIGFDEEGNVQLSKSGAEHVRDVVARFAPLAFRRPLAADRIDAFAALAQPSLDEGRPFLEAVRVPLRAVLSAPQFLFQAGGPGTLDDHALATRVAAFLWRATPDDELRRLADRGRLHKPKVLAEQVERLLRDPKSRRFVDDFAGQAYRLDEMGLTTPDAQLYRRYDESLGQAMTLETQLFFQRLIKKDLSVAHLIDADFTYVNRPLAEHYGIPDIAGHEMRRVVLPETSPRGGLLTQAAIHKITANGTSTSPVPRGNFVLESLLGKPTAPPPEGVASLEPDTRGTTTIREQLDAHRTEPLCESCHRLIDPPGFAMESFDPIGGFRTKYRPGNLAVDPSGVTDDGKAFRDLEEYKQILIEDELEQVARNLVSQLVVFGTGAEIEPRDEEEIERILQKHGEAGYPVRSLIHEVVKSDLFRSR